MRTSQILFYHFILNQLDLTWNLRMSVILFSAVSFMLGIITCSAVNVTDLPDELWHRTLTFVDMKHSEALHLRTLDRRTRRFYASDYTAMRRLECIIYSLESINQTVDYDLIWTLSKQIQLSSVGAIQLRVIQIQRYVVTRILGKHMRLNSKARKFMHALGFSSITIPEYNTLSLDTIY